MTDYVMMGDKLLYKDESNIIALDSMEAWEGLHYYEFVDKHTLRLFPQPRIRCLSYYMLAAEHTFFKFPQALYKLGVALAACGRYSDAVKEYKAALSLRPEYKDALYAFATTAHKAYKQHGNAEALLREVILINPEWPTAHFQLAIELKDGDPSKAAEEFYKAGALYLEKSKAGEELEMVKKCLYEIKLLSGKSSPAYKKLKYKAYQKKLSPIGQQQRITTEKNIELQPKND